MNKFVDVTKIMINNGNLNPIIPELVFEYIKIDETGKIKIYNEKNCHFDIHGPKKDELSTINYLRDKLKWDIQIIRRINENGVSTPDIRRVNEFLEYWEIKNIYKSESLNSRKSKIKHKITKQCNNFIFNLRNNFCDLTNLEALNGMLIRYYCWVKITLLGVIKENKRTYRNETRLDKFFY